MSRWPYSTSTWQRLREAKLSDRPICEACIRREVVTIADAVDHIVSIEKGGDAFPPLDGLMSLCASCHNSKTRRMDSGNSKGVSRFKGCDVNGDPLDDDDGWWAVPAPPLAHQAGGFRGRQMPPAGPSGNTNADLVFANDLQQGNSIWV